MLLRVYSNRFLRNHTGMVVPMYFLHAENFSLSITSIWGNFQTVASDSYFWKKRNNWVS